MLKLGPLKIDYVPYDEAEERKKRILAGIEKYSQLRMQNQEISIKSICGYCGTSKKYRDDRGNCAGCGAP